VLKKWIQFETEFNEKQILGSCWDRKMITMCLVGEPRVRSGADPPQRLFG
jgi:hypothetical protein